MTVGGVGEANAWAWMAAELDRYLDRYGWTLTNDEWPVVAAAQAVCTLAAQRISDAATAAGTQGSPVPLAVPAAIGPSGSTPSQSPEVECDGLVETPTPDGPLLAAGQRFPTIEALVTWRRLHRPTVCHVTELRLT